MRLENYVFGFNGQMKDDEVYGEGNSYTAEYWQYDPRLGRRWNVDPLSSKFPHQSPFATFDNKPIFFNDPNGKEAKKPSDWIKNKKTGEYLWNNDVTGSSNTPAGYEYIGKEDTEVVKNLFGKTSESYSDTDIGITGVEDFENPYSARGFASNYMATKSTMKLSITPVVNTYFSN